MTRAPAPALALLFAPLTLLSACITPLSATIRDQGTEVPLDQPVRVGKLVAIPQSIIEDSRCPENARCIWAGRLIVATRVDGPNWHETVPLTLGTPRALHGTTITLSSGSPERTTEHPTTPRDYRLGYDGGD